MVRLGGAGGLGILSREWVGTGTPRGGTLLPVVGPLSPWWVPSPRGGSPLPVVGPFSPWWGPSPRGWIPLPVVGPLSPWSVPSPRGGTLLPMDGPFSPGIRVVPTHRCPHTMALPWALLLLSEVLVQDATAQSCLIPPAAYNAALGRPASQSSLFPNISIAANAVDGNRDGVWHHGSCSRTLREREPWWNVDLGGRRAVAAVVVKNRQDCCWERLRGAQVHVGDAPATAPPTPAPTPRRSRSPGGAWTWATGTWSTPSPSPTAATAAGRTSWEPRSTSGTLWPTAASVTPSAGPSWTPAPVPPPPSAATGCPVVTSPSSSPAGRISSSSAKWR
uniref:Fucolectin tachylectin-4 pentraxin-1 domain-containing protein n=1 Tax=Calidris pygmaea TaxID=425635 RepID=A0A8C3J743_9CHAR